MSEWKTIYEIRQAAWRAARVPEALLPIADAVEKAFFLCWNDPSWDWRAALRAISRFDLPTISRVITANVRARLDSQLLPEPPQCAALHEQAQLEAKQVSRQRTRAKKIGEPAALTVQDMQAALDHFENACAYCGAPWAVIEHATSLGHWRRIGSTAANCLPACWPCNTAKGNKELEELIYWPTGSMPWDQARLIAALAWLRSRGRADIHPSCDQARKAKSPCAGEIDLRQTGWRCARHHTLLLMEVS